MMSTTMMVRRIRKLAPFLSSSSSSPLKSGCGWFSSKSSTDVAAVDVADVSAEEELLYPSVASTVKPVATLPTLLQPRVVVYDAVCHLCHRGTLTHLLLIGLLFLTVYMLSAHFHYPQSQPRSLFLSSLQCTVYYTVSYVS